MPRVNAEMKKPVRLEQRVAYTARHVPTITPYLKKMGVVQWTTKSDARFDCTGRLRLERGRRFGMTPETLADDQALAGHRRILQKVAYELFHNYPELTLHDIGFLLGGYSSSSVQKFMTWIPPKGL